MVKWNIYDMWHSLKETDESCICEDCLGIVKSVAPIDGWGYVCYRCFLKRFKNTNWEKDNNETN